MKKAYESPKAEKMKFDYSDAVVASGTGCISGEIWEMTAGPVAVGEEACHSQQVSTSGQYNTSYAN